VVGGWQARWGLFFLPRLCMVTGLREGLKERVAFLGEVGWWVLEEGIQVGRLVCWRYEWGQQGIGDVLADGRPNSIAGGAGLPRGMKASFGGFFDRCETGCNQA
jgi:hypothetical protein